MMPSMDQNNTTVETMSTGEAFPASEKHGLRMAGLIMAGFPSPAEEELRDVISFDDYLVPKPLSSFILRVSGDSMTGAGIMPGDLVIVEKGREPKNGNIVIAEVDGQWTMKYFHKENGRITLEAAHPGYPPFSDLKPDAPLQLSLFDDPLRVERICKTYRAVDELNQKYGKHTVHLGASHAIEVQGKGKRGEATVREQTRLFGETKRKHLGLPILHTKGV
jgi:hypothetical protein